MTTKLIFEAADKISPLSEDVEEDFDSGGMFLDKEDLQLIYNALSDYWPTNKEEHLHGILLAQFEEVLVIDYDEPIGVN